MKLLMGMEGQMILPRHWETDNSLDDLVGLKPKKEYLVYRRSGITGCEECPLKSLLQYGYGIRPRYRRKALDESSYAHITLALLLRGASFDKAAGIVMKIMDDVASESIDPTDVALAQNACKGFATGCFAHDHLCLWVKEQGFKIENIEEKFHGSLTIQRGEEVVGLDFRFQIDFMVVDKKTGDKYITDLKAIGTSLGNYSDAMHVYLQGDIYLMWAQQPTVLGPDVKGMIYLLVQKPSIVRKGMTRGVEQGFQEYVQECYDWLEGRGTHADKAAKRQVDPPVRIFLRRTSSTQKMMAAARLFEYVQRMQRGRNLVNFPVHDSCLHGNMTCEFLSEWCGSDARTWNTLLESEKFLVSRDPLDSERLSGQALLPVKTKEVKVRMVGHLPDIAKVAEGSRGVMSPKYAKAKVVF
jgi:hypothetical protein